uniref:Snake toxin/toxin-like domain-containing protein n=1 Tax=Balaenoptera musculus TaxID=9771 RepID=A0A8C0CF61_BALMU
MKVFLPVLLAALLGVERAHSLVCFSCVNKNSNWYCLKPTVRSDTDSYCVTISASAGIGNVVDFGGTWEWSLRVPESEPHPRDMLGGAPGPRPAPVQAVSARRCRRCAVWTGMWSVCPAGRG